MTITVIVFETTGLSDLAPPLMGVVCVAKTLADALGGPRSIYDAHVALKRVPGAGKRVIHVRFNGSVPRATVPEEASTRRARSER